MANMSFCKLGNVTVENQFKQVTLAIWNVLELVLCENHMYFAKSPFFPPISKVNTWKMTFCHDYFWWNVMMHHESTHKMWFAQRKITQFGHSMWKLWHFEFRHFWNMIWSYLANHIWEIQVLGLFGKVRERYTTFMLNKISFEAFLDM
jgi:hypothetical protein